MVRQALLAGASVMVLVAAATTPAAASRGWYVGIEGGVNFVEDTTVVRSVNLGVPTALGTTDVDTGWAVMGQIGYSWDSGWRLEFELGYRSNDGTLAVGVVQRAIEVTQFTQMVNVIYDIALTEELSLSLGAGLGGNLVSWENAAPVLGLTASYDDDYVLAGQLIAQLNYEISDSIDVFLDYRYFIANDPELSGIAGVNRSLERFDDTKHTVMVGLRFDLHEETAAAAPPLVQPPVVEAPAPQPKQFIVFFGWNKYNLTRQAVETVQQAAATAQQTGAASILVVGHTDTSGAPGYNQRLSVRRAETVKNELVRLGIEPNRIQSVGKGETELLVQTGDNVREPQNRRVEINL